VKTGCARSCRSKKKTENKNINHRSKTVHWAAPETCAAWTLPPQLTQTLHQRESPNKKKKKKHELLHNFSRRQHTALLYQKLLRFSASRDLAAIIPPLLQFLC
jgi:hypothetical protein